MPKRFRMIRKPVEQDDSSDRAIFYHDVDPTLAAEALTKGPTSHIRCQPNARRRARGASLC